MNPDFWRGRRVLVTGHTGFKGSWLCLWLHAAGARVAGYALDPPTEPSLYRLARVDALVDSTIADLRNLERLARLVSTFEPEVVLHMAAQSVVLTSYEDPIDTYTTNVIGTAHVFEAIRRSAVRCAVLNVTTDKCYLNRNWVWGYRETDTLGGRDPYSSSKACAELVGQAYRDSFFPEAAFDRHGVAIASARAGNVVGGGDWTAHQLIPEAIAALSRGEPVALRHPEAVRPWQHVLDCLNGYLMLAEKLVADPRSGSGEWNFGPRTAEPFPVARIVETLARHWPASASWVRAAGSTPHEERELKLDSSKAERLLGWTCRLSVESALEWVAQWYRAQAAGADARDLCLRQIERFGALARGA